MAANKFVNEQVIKYGLIIAVAYFGIINPLLKKIGVKDSAEDKAAAEDLKKIDFGSNQVNNPFSQVFLKNRPVGTLLISSATGAAYSQALKNAPGVFNDDETAVFDVFNKLKTQSQVTSLAYWFNQIYKKDLYTFLKDFLSNSELATIAKIVAAKPKYKI